MTTADTGNERRHRTEAARMMSRVFMADIGSESHFKDLLRVFWSKRKGKYGRALRASTEHFVSNYYAKVRMTTTIELP